VDISKWCNSMEDSKNFLVFDNAESGRGFEAIECAMALMFSCADIKGGKGTLNRESMKGFIAGAEKGRGKPFSSQEQEALFTQGAELAVARWSTRRLEHQANLWEEFSSKVRSAEPIYTFEQAVSNFKQERDEGRFRGLDDLHSALKEFTKLKATGEYKNLFGDEKSILKSGDNISIG